MNFFNYPPDNVLFLLDDVKCTGNETSIQNCPKSKWNTHDCKPYEIAGVVCRISDGITKSIIYYIYKFIVMKRTDMISRHSKLESDS